MQESSTAIEGFTTNDYAYCEDCKAFFDYWKYQDLEDAGHENCNVRNVTPEELKKCVEDCKETIDRCVDEKCDHQGSIVDSPEDREYHKGHEMIQESCMDEDSAYIGKHKPLHSDISG